MADSFDLKKALAERREQNLYRERLVVDSPQGVEVEHQGERYINFCSNDYLGLANHPEVVAALKQGADRYGAGSGASHLVIGHQSPHHQLEEALADFCGRERALLFSTGYMANVGVINALLGRQDHILEDRLNHASLLDGGLLSQARFQRYAHNDVAALEKKLNAIEQGKCLVVTDGVFSMDGDKAPLKSLANVCIPHRAWLMVDDAHGFGVVGERGAGLVNEAGLTSKEVPVLVGTLGKAFGTAGAFVAGDEELIEACIQWARTYIYTTGMAPAIAHATLTSLRLVQQEQWRRDHLQHLIQRFRHEAKGLGLQLMDSQTPIQPIVIGEPEEAIAWQQRLKQQGMLISAIRPPTVPTGTSRLRITFSAHHTDMHLDKLIDALGQCLKTTGHL